MEGVDELSVCPVVGEGVESHCLKVFHFHIPGGDYQKEMKVYYSNNFPY